MFFDVLMFCVLMGKKEKEKEKRKKK